MEIEQGAVAAVSSSDKYTFTKPVRDEIVLIAGVGVQGDVHAGVHVKHRGRVRADPTQPNFRQVHLIQRELFDEVAAKGYAVAAGNLGENVTTSGIDLLGLPVGTILRFGPPATTDGPAVVLGGSDSAGGRGGDGAEDHGVDADGGGGPLTAVLHAAARAKLDPATAASAVAIAAAVASDRGDDPRPAVVLAGLRNPCGQINGFAGGLLNEVVGRDAEGDVVRKAGVMAVVLRGGPVRPGDAVTAELPPRPHARLDRV